MAKKSKAKSRKSKSSDPKTKANLVEVHEVVRLLKVIAEEGRTDEFAEAARRSNATVTVDAETMTFVRGFLVKSQISKREARGAGLAATSARVGAAAARPGDRFKCF